MEVPEVCRGLKIPGIYTRIHQLADNGKNFNVSSKFLRPILYSSQLPRKKLITIWDLVDRGRKGYLCPLEFYTILALVAELQQGRNIPEVKPCAFNCQSWITIISKGRGGKLPRPDLDESRACQDGGGEEGNIDISGDLNRRSESSNLDMFTGSSVELSQQLSSDSLTSLSDSSKPSTYQELQDSELITIIRASDTGRFVKHQTYSVNSKRFNSCVIRRYSDFETFYDLLIRRYPFRLMPALPPKKSNPDRKFLESRRQGLTRFLNFISRHPVLRDDDTLPFFLTDRSADFSAAYKTKFYIMGKSLNGMRDEFYWNPAASNSELYLPDNVQTRLLEVRTKIDRLLGVFGVLVDVADRSVSRSMEAADDMIKICQQLRVLGTAFGEGELASKEPEKVMSGYRDMSDLFVTAADKYVEHANSESEGVIDALKYFYAVIVSFRELFDKGKDRLDGSFAGTNSSNSTTKNKTRRTIGGSSKIVGIDLDAERRASFELYCLWSESERFKDRLSEVATFFADFANSQISSCVEFQIIWQRVLECVASLMSG